MNIVKNCLNKITQLWYLGRQYMAGVSVLKLICEISNDLACTYSNTGLFIVNELFYTTFVYPIHLFPLLHMSI